MKLAYQCLRCQTVGAFDNPQEAFDAGWDVWPYFTVVYPLCPQCPTMVYLSEKEKGWGIGRRDRRSTE